MAEDIKHPVTGEVLAVRNELLDEEKVRLLDEAVVESVQVRSVLTCESQGGVCSLCYGRDLARGTPVNSGEAVGVIAAQSIGEPGTQLTMRTFHIGGAAQSQAERSSVEATVSGTLQLTNANLVVDSKAAPAWCSAGPRSSCCTTTPAARRRATGCPTAPACWSRRGPGREGPAPGRVGPAHAADHHRGRPAARCSWTWSRA